MDTFNEQNVIINFKLWKKLQFYQIFDLTSGTKIYGWNVHQLFFTVHTAFALIFNCYGTFGIVFTKSNTVSYVDLFDVFTTNTQIFLSLWRLFVLLNNTNRYLDLFKIAQINFLRSKQCSNYHKILYKHRDRLMMFTNCFLTYFVALVLQWIFIPLVINKFTIFENSNVRAKNIINYSFFVSTQTYNQYFIIFYIMELTIASITVYILIMTDILLISLCSTIVSQQGVLIHAFKNIGHEENPDTS